MLANSRSGVLSLDVGKSAVYRLSCGVHVPIRSNSTAMFRLEEILPNVADWQRNRLDFRSDRIWTGRVGVQPHLVVKSSQSQSRHCSSTVYLQ